MPHMKYPLTHIPGPNQTLLPIEVMKAPNGLGYYLGTKYQDPEVGAPVPYSRESVEYWPTKHAAEKALQAGDWIPRRYLNPPPIEFTARQTQLLPKPFKSRSR
mgnify:CR=1 FL=1